MYCTCMYKYIHISKHKSIDYHRRLHHNTKKKKYFLHQSPLKNKFRKKIWGVWGFTKVDIFVFRLPHEYFFTFFFLFLFPSYDT